MTIVETKEVPVPVREPIPEELLQDHYTESGITLEGPLILEQTFEYIDELISVINLYRADKKELRTLNSSE